MFQFIFWTVFRWCVKSLMRQPLFIYKWWDNLLIHVKVHMSILCRVGNFQGFVLTFYILLKSNKQNSWHDLRNNSTFSDMIHVKIKLKYLHLGIDYSKSHGIYSKTFQSCGYSLDLMGFGYIEHVYQLLEYHSMAFWLLVFEIWGHW